MMDYDDKDIEEVANLSALLHTYDDSWWIMHNEANNCIIVNKDRQFVQANSLKEALRAVLALYGAA